MIIGRDKEQRELHEAYESGGNVSVPDVTLE